MTTARSRMSTASCQRKLRRTSIKRPPPPRRRAPRRAWPPRRARARAAPPSPPRARPRPPCRAAARSSALTQELADEALARHAHQYGIAEGRDQVEPREERAVVCDRLPEADARVDDDRVVRHPRSPGGAGALGQEGSHLRHDVPVTRVVLHGRG